MARKPHAAFTVDSALVVKAGQLLQRMTQTRADNIAQISVPKDRRRMLRRVKIADEDLVQEIVQEYVRLSYEHANLYAKGIIG